jgi:hypothetical protein
VLGTQPGVTEAQPDGEPLREALKATAVALKQRDVAFALGGGYAAWAHGGPEPDHDVDFLVPATEADRARQALADAGLRVEQPPEDWLFKVFRGPAMVDVIHHLAGEPLDDELLSRVEDLEVLSVRMPVLTATELMRQKLDALDEHDCDFARLLPVARALREQVDWVQVRDATRGNAFAVAFLVLLAELGVAPG